MQSPLNYYRGESFTLVEVKIMDDKAKSIDPTREKRKKGKYFAIQDIFFCYLCYK